MLKSGETISHFRIIDELGRGGMGVVFRAHDERLDRDVALKVLPAGMLTDETARSRFRREALTLSRLSHPNIAVVYDFDSQNGVDFITMEFVEGETLATKVAAGPLAEKDVIAIGTQIAEALEEAHEQEAIHRDLKPANVIVTTKGRVKVLDFGLAKLVKSSEQDAATASLADSQPGLIMGTVPYMAPEQLQGKPADARTDVYALGAVMYEMAAGNRPFPEKCSSTLIASILTEPPRPPRELNNEISLGLEAIILKALEKNSEERYQSAKEVLEDLGRLSLLGSAVMAPLPKIQSIAVLPLVNFSGDPDQEYFADGMTEELITNLGKISALRVISRTTAMHFKGTKKTLPEIARQLKVDAIVEGSVLRSGNRVRITAQLIEARREKHLWAESYERELREVLSLQTEVARAITREIKSTVTPDELARLETSHTVNPDAYRLYLEGRYQFSKRTVRALEKSRQLFHRALRKAPNYALAYAGLAESYGIVPFYGDASPKDAFPQAKTAALKALELDNSLAEGHAALGFVMFYWDWNWEQAERELKHAIEIKPNYVIVHHWYAEYLSAMGRHEEAIAEVKRAQEIDPLSPLLLAVGGEVYNMAGHYDEAITQCRKALNLDPNYTLARNNLATGFFYKGMYEQALSQYQKAERGIGGDPSPRVARVYAQAGKTNVALKILGKLTQQTNREDRNARLIALLNLALGEKQKALGWLERAYQTRDPYLVFLNVHPGFAALRSEPQFQDLLLRMNFPSETLGTSRTQPPPKKTNVDCDFAV